MSIPEQYLHHHSLRVATIGCGRMGASVRPEVERWAPDHLRDTTHLSAIRALGIARELAAADVALPLLEQAASHFALDATFTDTSVLLRDFAPDLLTIATRTPLKARLLSEAVARGVRAIHLEKPLCNTEAERRHLDQLFRHDGLLVTSGCLRRYAAPYAAARDWFATDDDGGAQEIAISMGKTPLAWTQFHAVDLALFLAGPRKVAKVQATLHGAIWQGSTVVNDPLVGGLTLLFEDGLVARIGQGIGAMVCLSKARSQYEIVSDGHQAFRAQRPDPQDPYLRKTAVPVDPGPFSGTQAPLALLTAAHLGHSPSQSAVRIAMQDLVLAQQICFAALISDAEGGRRISPDAIPDDLVFLAKTGDAYA